MADPRIYGLTTRAAELLAVMRAWKRMEGIIPSYDDLACDLGVRSKSTVHRLVCQLEDRGLIRRLPHQAQSIELIEPRAVTLPSDLYDRLAADAERAGRDLNEHLADAVRAFLPSPTTAAREREWSSSPSPF